MRRKSIERITSTRRTRHVWLAAFLAFTLAKCADVPPLAPVATASFEGRPASIENRYIVLFRNDVADPTALTRSLLAAHGGNLGHIYQFALKGFAVANLPPQAVEALRQNPMVRSVEAGTAIAAI